jgi:hypothetical protein
MLLRGTGEDNKKDTNTLCGQNAEFSCVKASGIIHAVYNHWSSKGYEAKNLT